MMDSLKDATTRQLVAAEQSVCRPDISAELYLVYHGN